jgi:phenylacetic acid degradation operon negative regulatory protein
MSQSAPIDRLIAFGPLKVWSVVMTIMGDLCRDPADRIEGPLLSRLVEEMGINNQALRVALHRLKRDGWIEAEKDGRVSSYALTTEGRARSEAVRPVIYATEAPGAAEVFLVLPDPAMGTPAFADAMPDDTVFPSPRSALSTGPRDALPEGALVAPFDPSGAPDWVVDVVISPKALREYEALTATLTGLGYPSATVLPSTVIRLLAFHHWRRLRLRHGDLPDLLLGPDWSGAKARAAISSVLEDYPRPTLDDLRTAAGAPAS